jgi:membrane fusion protein, multidrug efflux system
MTEVEAASGHGGPISRIIRRLRAEERQLTPALMVVCGILVALFVLCTVAYFVVPEIYAVRTDDAYVDAHVETIMPKVAAYVRTLHVDDNSPVRAGELLVELDPRDYEVKVKLAQADVDTASGRLGEAREQVLVAGERVRQAMAELGVSRANARLAGATLDRVRGVADIRAISAERVDEAGAAADGTRSTVLASEVAISAATSQARLARAQVVTAEASLAKAHAALSQAELDLSYTKIYATQDGTVVNRIVEAGNFVQPGQVLFSVTPSEIYVIANYKETQLERIRPGDAAVVEVDSLGELRLRAHVDSIQRGTGSRFALLPPENATGNFVKIVQRVPVKLVFDRTYGAMRRMSPGMSVEAEVFVSRRRSQQEPVP